MASRKIFVFFVLYMTLWSDGIEGYKRQCGVFRCEGPPPKVENGAFVVMAGRRQASLQCDPGYDTSGQKTISCAANLKWSSRKGLCQGLSGTDFVTVFPRTEIQDGLNLRRILITANGPTNVNITNGATTVSVVVNDILVREFPISLTLTQNNVVNDKVVRISSDLPINVHTLVLSTDSLKAWGSYINRPINKLYTEYILITTEHTPQFNVIAIEDNTRIRVTRGGGRRFTRRLNKNQVYTRFYGNNDRTGYLITSNKDVAVIAGGYFARVPNTSGSRDLNVAQLIGVEDWKRLYIMGPYKPRDGFQFTVVASQDNTTVSLSINGVSSIVSLNRRAKHIEFLAPNAKNRVVVQSDKPVLVAQFSLNNVGDIARGADSSMVLCVPPEDWLDVYRFFAPEPQRNTYLRIIIRSAFKDDLRLNDTPLTTFYSVSVMVPGGDSYDILFVEVTTTNVPYKLETVSGEPFGADLYGLGTVPPTQYTHSLGRKL